MSLAFKTRSAGIAEPRFNSFPPAPIPAMTAP
jgi:hypothetical protein